MPITWWFTSDTHFGHGNIIKSCGRPFFNKPELEIYLAGNNPNASIEEKNALSRMRLSSESLIAHDETLIENWNECVKPKDKVIHLGDFAFASQARLLRLLARLKGNISLILGNHDKSIKKIKEQFEWVDTYKEITIQDVRNDNKLQRLVLCHYAFKTWNGSNRGVWNLYGHSHGKLSEDNSSLAIDVGVDAVAKRLSSDCLLGELPKPEHYRPIAFEEIKDIMRKKQSLQM